MYCRLVCGCLLAAFASVDASHSRIQSKSDSLLSNKIPWIAIGAVRAQAEQIDLDERQEGTQELTLHRSARVIVGNLRASGNKAVLSCSSKGAQALRLDGNVRLVCGAIRAAADRAEIDLAAETLELKSGSEQPAALHGGAGTGGYLLEAAYIRLQGLKRLAPE